MEGIKYIPKEVLDKLLSLGEEELHEVLEHFINKYGNHDVINVDKQNKIC